MHPTPYALTLQNIELHNFRAFGNVSLTFHPRLTVMIGENGAGKTTILDSLAGMLRLYVDKLCSGYSDDVTLLKAAFKNNDIQYGKKKAILAIKTLLTFESISFVEPEDESKRKQLAYDIEHNEELDLNAAERNDMVEEINWLATLTPKKYAISNDENDIMGFEYLDKFVQTINFRLRSAEATEVSLPLVAYYPLDRIDWAFQKAIAPVLEVDIFNAFDDCLDANKSLNFDLFARWFKWQENLSRQTKNTTLLDTVCTAIYTVLNDEPELPKYQSLYTDYTNPDLPDGDLHITVSGSNVSVSQLSSGEKTIFLLVADIARRLALANPDATNPLNGQGIVLIDEIDLHLHPRWQRKIVPQLLKTFPNCQFVVTTHSVQVLGEIENKDKIVYLLNNNQVSSLPYSGGLSISNLATRIFGDRNRSVLAQSDIDRLFQLIENEKDEEATTLLRELQKKYGETDEALLEAFAILH